MRLASCWTPLIEYATATFDVERARPHGEPSAASGVAAATVVARELLDRLEAAQKRAGDEGHSAFAVHESLFAVVAWLDERAMNSAWDGAAAWRAAPLQQTCFGTVRAGAEFYERLDALPDDAAQVRETFALMLLLGFRGRFATRPAAEFASYRNALLEQVVEELRMAPLNAHAPLFPQPDAAPPTRPRLKRSATMIAVLLVAVPVVFLAGMIGLYDVLLSLLSSNVMAGP
ncbi:DotU family type IV/VI secretion system protein [Paraburkholderia agricolaris]|uniref:DotU family type IV/VI secretion system protein n=1 Tax=Paraburkholderia agricolaris TaxID=2152888 RepID=UPI0038BAE436